ncbi:MAG: hypothetical protein ABEH56_01500 [Salinirussus sp.]
MNTDRRSVLKAGGLAALLGTTGLAGCSGLLAGGGSSAASWQYDPAALSETANKFFGSMDVASLYQARENLPESTRQGLENPGDSPIDPSELDAASGVAGMTVSTGERTFAAFGSVALTGSFAASDVTDAATEDGEAEQVGEYQGYSLWESTGDVTGSTGIQDSTATLAVSEGALVVGAAGARGTETSVTGEAAVKKMIDANNGDAKRLRTDNQFIKTLSNELGSGSGTFRVGGAVDPALIAAYAGMAGGGGGQFFDGLRAGGLDMAIDGSTTTFTGVVVYEDSQAARDTEMKKIVERFGSTLTEREEYDSVSASYSGQSVIVTLKGDTKALFEQGASQAPVDPGGGI